VNVFPEGGVEIHSFVLRAELEAPRWELPREPMSGADPSAAQHGTRRAIWDDPRRPVETPVYDQPSLRPGNRAAGPAIVEAAYTTIVVEPGWDLEIDPSSNLVISKR
jgi:N-methylhydantoinase A/acetophenone carboxylase